MVELKVRSKFNSRFFGVPRVEQSWSCSGHRAYKSSGQLDREAELVFARWAGYLNETICLDEGDEPPKSVYAWGKELAELEATELDRDDARVVRMYRIAAMLVAARLIWRGGPCWWREL